MSLRRSGVNKDGGAVVPAPKSLADLKKGVRVCGDCGSDPSKRPDWATSAVYDPEQMKKWFDDHLFSLVLAWHCSLVLGFNLPGLLAPLVYTKESDTPKKAFSRYLATFGHLASWHTGGDIFEPSSPSYTSVATVRTFHATVRKNMNRDEPVGPKDPFWISAYNMGCVQSGFCGAVTLVPRQFGITPTNGGSTEELGRYVNFWRCVAKQLGLDDKYNLCGAGEKIADSIIRQVIEEVILPDASHPVPEVSPMSEAYVDGMNLVFCGCRVLTVKSTLAYSMDGLKKPFPKGMTFCDYFRFLALKIVVCILSHVSCARLLLNWGVRRTLFSTKTMDSAAKSCEEDPVVAICPASGHRGPRLRRRGNFSECPGKAPGGDIGDVCSHSKGKQSHEYNRACCRCEPLCISLSILSIMIFLALIASIVGVTIGSMHLIELAAASRHDGN